VAALRRIVLGAVVAVLALGGCGDDEKETPTSGSTLRVGYSLIPDSGDLAGRMALERYGRDHDVRVEFERLQGVPNTIASLRRGEVDIASLNLPDVIKAVGEGVKIKVILAAKMFPEYVFVAAPPTARPEQLKGKRIGIQGKGSDVEAFTKVILGRAGLGLGDVRLMTIPNSTARVAALTSDRIDATGLRYHEYLRLLNERPQTRTLAETRTYAPTRMTQTWVVTDRFARENAGRLRPLVREMLGVYASMYTPEGRSAYLAAGSREVFRGDPPSMPPRIYEFYRRHALWPRPDRPITPAEHQRQLDQMLSTGQVSKPVAFRDVWEPSFWQSAAGGS
jgi:ABC-type nitrate/sulfonate/bicarbonate transport system substrate-binding protein